MAYGSDAPTQLVIGVGGAGNIEGRTVGILPDGLGERVEYEVGKVIFHGLF